MGILESITGIGSDVVNTGLSTISNILVAFITPLLDVGKTMIVSNINPFHFQSLWVVIVGAISSFYFLVFLIVGLKFLLGSYDAEQRKDAKEWLKKAILLVITVNASLVLYSLVLDLSSSAAVMLWDDRFESLFAIENLNVTDIMWLGLFATALLLAVITLVARQIFLIMGVMLFPIGLFLYFIEPVKVYGSAIVNVIGGVAFMNVLDVVILIAVQLFWAEFNTMQVMNILAPSLGFLFIAVANVVLFVLAVLKGISVLGVKVNVETIVKAVAGTVAV